MNNKKNIDRLFQEKFKDFDVKPDSKVWQNIESKLQKEEKDDRVVIIPFWLKLSGIAASLLLMLFLGKNLFNNPENSTIPNVVDIEKTENNTTIDKTNSTIETKELNAPEHKPESDVSNTSSSSTIVDNENPSNTSKEETTTLQKNNSKNSYYKTRKTSTSQLNTATSIVSNTSSSPKNNTNYTNSNNTQKLNNNVVESDNYSSPNKNVNTDVALQQQQNKKDNTNKLDKTFSNPSNTEDVAMTDINKTEKNTTEDSQKSSIEDAIAEAKNNEDLIEKEKDDVANRWSINTNISPVYYNVIGQGSHIHEQFNQNTKSGAVNTSYGVKVGYALNDNITVRSGINKLNLSYDTNDVVVYEKLGNNSSLRNVNFSSTNAGQSLNMISGRNVNIIESSIDLNQAINQQMSYYEVPLELEYKLLKKRIGINIIGGFSTFLLDNNELTSQLNGVDTKIGEANNINSVSFSTNLGIGIDYKVSKSVLFNVEPTFKYHLNAFNQTSGNFNPYILGLYTGVSYRF